MLDITWNMIICQESLLIGIDQCRLCLIERHTHTHTKKKSLLSEIISSCHAMSFLFNIVNRLFCVSIHEKLHLIVLFSLLIS